MRLLILSVSDRVLYICVSLPLCISDNEGGEGKMESN